MLALLENQDISGATTSLYSTTNKFCTNFFERGCVLKIDMCNVLLRAPLHSGNSFVGGGLRFSFWTKTSGDHWICRMFTRAYAFEKLYPESNPENSFYGCTTKKIICERLKLIVCDLGVSKSAQNHGIWVPQGVCENSSSMKTTKLQF